MGAEIFTSEWADLWNDSINGNDGTDILVGGTGNNDASPGDAISDGTANIDEAFTLDPLPGWVDQV